MWWTFWSWLYMAYTPSEWIVRLVMLPIVTQRRKPTSAMAWLLVIFFLPWPGLILYLLIGENQLPGRRIKRRSRLSQELQALAKRYQNHPEVLRAELAPEALRAVQLAERLGSMPVLEGNAVEFLSRTTDTIDRLVADIEQAKHHVHLLFYIYANDETGRRVADALRRAAARGVTCRVLMDAVGSRPALKTLAPTMIEGGIEVHPMLPVNLLRRGLARMDMRNHRKLAVIDGEIAYTGSQNIVNADYGHKNLAWHDMMMRVTGPVTLELQVVFVSDWYFETTELIEDKHIFPTPQVTGSVPVQTLPSGPNYPTENYQRIVTAMLYAAEQQVIITTPYFVPDEATLQAIQVAVLRGVRVKLVTPEHCDQVLVGAAGRAYYDDLLQIGAELYFYPDGLLHAKTITIDKSVAFVGSSNFDIRSFQLNFELNLLLYGAEICERLRLEQERYLAVSRQITLEIWRRRSRGARMFQRIARLFSPLL